MPLQATSGAASYDAFGGGVAAVPQYIEEVFSTWLYTGNGSTQTITNGIDLAGKGGLVWIKARANAYGHFLTDTARGSGFPYPVLSTNTTAAQTPSADGVYTFDSSGFTTASGSGVNQSNATYVSWTFRKQPKFFDVVTYTGTGSFFIEVAHSLGSAPGFIAIKPVSEVGDWICAARRSSDGGFQLGDKTTRFGFNSNNSSNSAAGGISNNPPANFSPNYCIANGTLDGTARDFVNKSGVTYVAYLFAHNAGGFGLTGTDNVISCGSFTSIGSALSVNVGYEPQWLLFKRSNGTYPWRLVDNMRGFQVDRNAQTVALEANSNAAESGIGIVGPTSTGFTFNDGGSGETYIYIAIRRGPMKVPTTGASVFSPIARTGTSSLTSITSAGFGPDLVTSSDRTGTTGQGTSFFDRLRGPLKYLQSRNTGDELSRANSLVSYDMNGFTVGPELGGEINLDPYTYVNYLFKRAPGFFDVVCYTGTGANRTVAHNLAAVPELIIVKQRSAGTGGWVVYSAASGATKYQYLNTTIASVTYTQTWNNTAPTASVFTVGTDLEVNNGSTAYIAYLFASCPGVSKVGSYTGTGATQTINCGFTGGARFILIKRTNSTGDWYVWDTARGIVAGNDPHLSLNTAAAEVTSNDTIDTDSTGFVVNQVAATNVNVSGGAYIYLAIA